MEKRYWLTTYDSVLSYNEKYESSPKALDFAKILKELVSEFCMYSGVLPENVYWKEVEDSDLCKIILFIYAVVPNDWTPKEDTLIFNEELDKRWYPYSAFSFKSYIQGGAKNIDINTFPPQNPHNLFKSKEI